MSNLILNFPESYTPSSSQVKILKKIEQSISNGEKFIVCNAPTGSGKSFFAPTLAKYIGGPSDTWKSRVDDYSIFGDKGSEYVNEEDLFGVYEIGRTHV
jgi:ABC-type iron transport system FetAB ATPase subunit